MRRMVADSRGFNPRMRYFNTNSINYTMKSYCIVYRGVYEDDQTKWEIYPGYVFFADALHDMTTSYQFKGMLFDHGWWIYGVQEDGKMIKLNHDGTPI